jgi:SAM-dependent methyltransferase
MSGSPIPGSDPEEQAKYRRNLEMMRAIGREPFMVVIRQAQDEVAAVSDPHYTEEYRSQETHYWAPIARWLYQRSEETDAIRALDAGCGSGTLAAYMSRIFGSPTMSLDMLSRRSTTALSDRGVIRFEACNIEMEPIPFQGPFDIVVLTEVLEHLNFHPVPTLIKLRDSIAVDGRIYLSTPDAAEWGRVTTYYPDLESMPSPAEAKSEIESGRRTYFDDHIWQYDESELMDVIARSGLEVLRLEYSPGVLHRHFNLELARATPPPDQGSNATAPVRDPT